MGFKRIKSCWVPEESGEVNDSVDPMVDNDSLNRAGIEDIQILVVSWKHYDYSPYDGFLTDIRRIGRHLDDIRHRYTVSSVHVPKLAVSHVWGAGKLEDGIEPAPKLTQGPRYEDARLLLACLCDSLEAVEWVSL